MAVGWSRGGYFEALEAYNIMHDPEAAKDAAPKAPSGRLQRFVQAHAVND